MAAKTPPARKPFEKRYKTVVPVPRMPDTAPATVLGGDDEREDHRCARWLGRESFERTIAGDGLEIVDYAERLIPIAEVDPRLAEMLGRPVDDFDWFEFSATGRLNQELFDYLAAEFAAKCAQWLAAEQAWREESAGDVKPTEPAGSGD